MMGCSCMIGKNIVVIMPNSDVMACRRFPIIIGNLKNETLKDIWLHSNFIKDIRMRSIAMQGKCKDCKFYNDVNYKNICGGGCPSMSIALGGTMYDPDPMCWIKEEMSAIFLYYISNSSTMTLQITIVFLYY